MFPPQSRCWTKLLTGCTPVLLNQIRVDDALLEPILLITLQPPSNATPPANEVDVSKEY